MKIEISKIESVLKDVLKESEILSVDSVYEKDDNDSNVLKLIITINKLYYNSLNVLYTKIIFRVDLDKVYVIKDYFTYLYDINCVYKQVNFSDIDDFKNKLKTIFDKNIFGDDLRNLSKFMISPASIINEFFFKEGIETMSIINFKYEPKVNIIPCKYLNFSFNINLNNRYDIDLVIDKVDKDSYFYHFTFFDEKETVEKKDLSDIGSTIGSVLKNKVLKNI